MATRGTLLRVLGSGFGLAMVVGATIGGGILSTPGSVAAALPNTWLFMAVWAFGGVSALLGTTAFSELGAMMPESGGFYVFAQRAFGDGVGFFVGYGDWINWSLGVAVLVLLIGQYLGAIVPAIAGHVALAGFVVVTVLVGLQWIGVRSGGRVQEVTSILKGVALGALIIAIGLMHPAAPPATTPAAILPHGTALIVALGVAMQGVIFSYDSYYAIVYCGAEIREPGRAIPLAMFRGTWLVIAAYLLLNAAFVFVVPVGQIAGDSFIGATITRLLFGARGDVLIRLLMIVAILGTVNAQIMAAPRVLLAMARKGLFPAQATRVNAGGTPTVALLLTLLLVAAFVLMGTFELVLAVDAILILLLYVICFSALFVLRRREPDMPRPYRAWGYPYAPAGALLIAVVLMLTMVPGAPLAAAIVVAMMVLSWPVARMVRSHESGES